MTSNFKKYKVVLIFVLFMGLAFVLGISFGREQSVATRSGLIPGQLILNNNEASTTEGPIDMDPFWQVWNILDDKYVATKINKPLSKWL